MKKLGINIEVHLPMQMRIYRFFDIGNNHYYYDDYVNEYYTRKISEESYLPANRILSDLIHKYGEKIEINFLFSGVVLDQFELYAPEAIESFKSLIGAGSVNLVSGSYSNSFGPVTDKAEYQQQVNFQKKRISALFGKEPLDLPYRWLNNSGAPYKDAIIKRENQDETVNLFVPYNIFGNNQVMNSVILEILKLFTDEEYSKSDFESIHTHDTENNLLSSQLVSFSSTVEDKNIGLFYASCNEMQIDALEKLNSIRRKIRKCDDPVLVKDWLFLQSCDHFYYMNPDLYEDTNFKFSFIPYDSPYMAYINYMNILDDFSGRFTMMNINEISVNEPAMKKWTRILKKSPVMDLLE